MSISREKYLSSDVNMMKTNWKGTQIGFYMKYSSILCLCATQQRQVQHRRLHNKYKHKPNMLGPGRQNKLEKVLVDRKDVSGKISREA